jgi:hypothetical protein
MSSDETPTGRSKNYMDTVKGMIKTLLNWISRRKRKLKVGAKVRVIGVLTAYKTTPTFPADPLLLNASAESLSLLTSMISEWPKSILSQ